MDAEPSGTTPARRDGPVDQLPREARPLVGRELEVGRARAWIGRHRRRDQPAPILLIEGTPGTGRSALAIALARELAAELPGPRLWARLGGGHGWRQHPDEQLRRWLRELGAADGELPAEQRELAERFVRQLAGTAAVVVVEEAATADELARLRPPPGCVMIATADGPLPPSVELPGVRQLALRPLRRVDALKLLSVRAGWGRLAAEPGAARTILQCCGQLPLALVVAGATMAGPGARVAVGEFARHLADETERLGGDGLTAVLTLADRWLGGRQAQAFRALGLLDLPTVAPEALAAMLCVDRSEAGDRLEELADAGLVDSDGHPYRLHDLVRAFARSLALQVGTEAQRRAVLRRAVAAYREKADLAAALLASTPSADDERARSSRAGARAWAAAEESNLLVLVGTAATAAAGSFPDAPPAGRPAGAPPATAPGSLETTLGMAIDEPGASLRDPPDPGATPHDPAVRGAEPADHGAVQGHITERGAPPSWAALTGMDSLTYLEQVGALCAHDGAESVDPTALLNPPDLAGLSTTLEHLRRVTSGPSVHRVNAVDHGGGRDDAPDGAASGAPGGGRGELAGEAARLAAATDRLLVLLGAGRDLWPVRELGLASARRAGAIRLVAWFAHRLGTLHADADRQEQAAIALRGAVALADRAGDEALAMLARFDLGYAWCKLHRFEDAAPLLEGLLGAGVADQELGDLARANLGYVYRHLGREAEARELLEESLRSARRRHDARLAAFAERNLTKLARAIDPGMDHTAEPTPATGPMPIVQATPGSRSWSASDLPALRHAAEADDRRDPGGDRYRSAPAARAFDRDQAGWAGWDEEEGDGLPLNGLMALEVALDRLSRASLVASAPDGDPGRHPTLVRLGAAVDDVRPVIGRLAESLGTLGPATPAARGRWRRVRALRTTLSDLRRYVDRLGDAIGAATRPGATPADLGALAAASESLRVRLEELRAAVRAIDPGMAASPRAHRPAPGPGLPATDVVGEAPGAPSTGLR